MKTKQAPAVTLPDKPSELLTIALDDLEAIENTPGYLVDMATYADARYGPCRVCLAGASLVRRMAVAPGTAVWPEDFDDATGRKLRAIDHLRTGWVPDAFTELGLIESRDLDRAEDLYRIVTPYEVDSTAFKRELRQLAADLAAAGF